MNRQTFGRMVRISRERLGLTQAELAAKSGLQPSAVCFFETGARTPSLENLIVVADALGESLDVLTGRTTGVAPTGKDAETLLSRFGTMRDDDRAALLRIAAIFAERAQSPFARTSDTKRTSG